MGKLCFIFRLLRKYKLELRISQHTYATSPQDVADALAMAAYIPLGILFRDDDDPDFIPCSGDSIGRNFSYSYSNIIKHVYGGHRQDLLSCDTGRIGIVHSAPGLLLLIREADGVILAAIARDLPTMDTGPLAEGGVPIEALDLPVVEAILRMHGTSEGSHVGYIDRIKEILGMRDPMTREQYRPVCFDDIPEPHRLPELDRQSISFMRNEMISILRKEPGSIR